MCQYKGWSKKDEVTTIVVPQYFHDAAAAKTPSNRRPRGGLTLSSIHHYRRIPFEFPGPLDCTKMSDDQATFKRFETSVNVNPELAILSKLSPEVVGFLAAQGLVRYGSH